MDIHSVHEDSDTESTVSFAPSSGVNNESYRITAFSNCNPK